MFGRVLNATGKAFIRQKSNFLLKILQGNVNESAVICRIAHITKLLTLS